MTEKVQHVYQVSVMSIKQISEAVEAEAKEIKRSEKRTLEKYKELGKLLVKAKKLLKDESWDDWLVARGLNRQRASEAVRIHEGWELVRKKVSVRAALKALSEMKEGAKGQNLPGAGQIANGAKTKEITSPTGGATKGSVSENSGGKKGIANPVPKQEENSDDDENDGEDDPMAKAKKENAKFLEEERKKREAAGDSASESGLDKRYRIKNEVNKLCEKIDDCAETYMKSDDAYFKLMEMIEELKNKVFEAHGIKKERNS